MADRVKKGNGNQRREIYTRVVFPQYTDRELVGVDLRIDDPLSLPNRSDEEPPRDQTITFVGHYEQGRTIRCVFGHRHQSGFAFRDEQGRHYLVGGTCGKNVMGVQEWQQVVGQYKELRQRADYLRQLRALSEVLDRHRDWMHRLADTPAIVALGQVRARLIQRRDLYQAGQLAVRYRDGQVETSERARDIPAEEARETREEREIARFSRMTELEQVAYIRQRPEPRITTSHIYKRTVVPLGPLRGKVLFERPAADPKLVRTLVAELYRLIAIGTMTVQTSELKKRSMNIRDLLDTLNKIHEDIVDAISFFEQTNLERVAAWATDKEFDRASYRALPGVLQIVDEDTGTELRLARPQELAPLEDPVFTELREARSAFLKDPGR